MSSYEEHVAFDARLVILRVLAGEQTSTLNETILIVALERFGHRRSREWVRTQLRKLAELGAVKLTDGTVLVAEITRAGLDHVERRSTLDGVARPSPGA